MKKITQEQFLADVLHEATKLRELLTPKEKSLLDFERLNPASPRNCIYGQATGSCESDRSKDLMDQCCIRVIDYKKSQHNDAIRTNFNALQPHINGDYTGQTWTPDSDSWGERSYFYHSVLEAYILLEGSNNSGLISYIKGEVDSVKL